MADYDRLATQVRAMKPGEWLTVDRDSVDDNARIAPWRDGHWTPCDFILEQIVGSGYEWSWQQNPIGRAITFKRRQHPLKADDLRTWVSPDRAHYYRLRADDIYEPCLSG